MNEMIDAYITLHKMGIAHSVEAWQGNRLVGGLYGVCMGKTFFGESMFSLVPNASKVALVALAQELESQGFGMIDCQVTSGHLLRMGAQEITRDMFLDILKHSLDKEVPGSLWRAGRHLLDAPRAVLPMPYEQSIVLP